ncbi:hypothetical protein PV392_01675 [Streptomyces sp. ME03-5709C]|nr:hypothetical protein [Streptomyces sp. ME03-5709C]
MRDDITGTDVVLLLGGIHRAAAPLLPVRPQAWRRYLALALDGPVATDAGPLPEPPPARLQVAEPTTSS